MSRKTLMIASRPANEFFVRGKKDFSLKEPAVSGRW